MYISEFIKRLLGMEVEDQNSIIVTLLVVIFLRGYNSERAHTPHPLTPHSRTCVCV